MRSALIRNGASDGTTKLGLVGAIKPDVRPGVTQPARLVAPRPPSPARMARRLLVVVMTMGTPSKSSEGSKPNRGVASPPSAEAA